MLRNKLIQNLGKCVGLFAFCVAMLQANAACPYFTYQPELPDSVKKLRKL